MKLQTTNKLLKKEQPISNYILKGLLESISKPVRVAYSKDLRGCGVELCFNKGKGVSVVNSNLIENPLYKSNKSNKYNKLKKLNKLKKSNNTNNYNDNKCIGIVVKSPTECIK